MEIQYYIRRGTELAGPFTSRTLKEMAAGGKIAPSDEISMDRKTWVRASDARGLGLTVGAVKHAASPAPDDVRPFDAFISYSKHNQLEADTICGKLEAAGVRCWIATRNILPGVEWGEGIIEGIDRSRLMVLVFSEHANASPQVRREVERAISKQLPLIPFRVENTAPARSLEYFLGNTHWLDAFDPPLERHIARLTDVVKRFLDGDPPVVSRGERRAGSSGAGASPHAADGQEREAWPGGGSRAQTQNRGVPLSQSIDRLTNRQLPKTVYLISILSPLVIPIVGACIAMISVAFDRLASGALGTLFLPALIVSVVMHARFIRKAWECLLGPPQKTCNPVLAVYAACRFYWDWPTVYNRYVSAHQIAAPQIAPNVGRVALASALAFVTTLVLLLKTTGGPSAISGAILSVFLLGWAICLGIALSKCIDGMNAVNAQKS